MDSGDVRRIVVFLLMLLRREWNVYAKTLNNSYLHNSPLPNLPMAEFLQVTLICSNDSTIHMIRTQTAIQPVEYFVCTTVPNTAMAPKRWRLTV